MCLWVTNNSLSRVHNMSLNTIDLAGNNDHRKYKLLRATGMLLAFHALMNLIVHSAGQEHTTSLSLAWEIVLLTESDRKGGFNSMFHRYKI